MAGRTSRDPNLRRVGGTLLLDSEGLAKTVLRDRTVTAWLALARADDLRVITAMLSATALAAPGPVTILTSDPEYLTALCGAHITIIRV